MSFQKTYDDLYQAQLQKNERELARNKKLAYKDPNKSYTLGYELEYVEYLRLTNPVFFRTYIKDPAKQNISEKALKEFLTESLNIEITKLPSDKKTGLKIAGGSIQKANSCASTVKTIDFSWQKNGKIAYASHKYTRGEGGSQDGARQELERFMVEGRSLTSVPEYKNVIIFAIGDGTHYETVVEGASLGRHELMNNEFGKPGRVISCTADEVFDYWTRFLES